MDNITILLTWTDPQDNDNGVNHGSKQFVKDEDMVSWLTHKLNKCPRLEFTAFRGKRILVDIDRPSISIKIV